MKVKHAAALVLLALAMPAGAKEKPAQSARAADAVLAKVYRSYQIDYSKQSISGADWESPLWSREIRTLVKAWRRHIGDEMTGLNDYSWFCECQDWDWQQFKWKRTGLKEPAPGRLEVSVHIEQGWDTGRDQRFNLLKEKGKWMIDDFFSEAEPGGIKAALKREIAEPVGE